MNAPRVIVQSTAIVVLACLSALPACSGGGDAGGDAAEPENCSTSPASDPDEGSELMRPGGNCMSCHRQEGEGPGYTVAGTVMADYADDENCEGMEGVTVEITGADGKVTSITSNAVGNFFYEGAIATPYTARVVSGEAELVMVAPQNDLNCANCHSSPGTSGAPGRIVAP